MSEFVDYGGFGSETTEIYLKRTLTGDVNAVRVRLAAALERLGYDVIEDDPVLRGRRGAKGWGTWYGSADVLDYATTLVIRLKPAGPHATRATFDYAIKHPWLSAGEKAVLTHEAEAITSLATMRASDRVCAACGTEATEDSLFCRGCGAPLSSEQAELEVFRMVAQTRAGHTSVVTSAILALSTLAVTIFAFIVTAIKGTLTTKAFLSLFILTSIVALCNLFVSSCAWKRLNLALRTKRVERQSLRLDNAQQMADAVPAALPPKTAAGYVTEGTTELFETPKRERERVPINERGNDTDAIN
jgi:hypothetical protein